MGGTVSYNVTGWLEKNKDPVNDTVVDVLKRSSVALQLVLWADHPGQSAPPDEGKKKKKKGGGKTVASVYLVQLAELMTTLNSTEPHFIRCIVPNTHKKPFEAEKYRCGHTMVFFRAGALAALEEARDGIVLKLVRWMQGEVFGRVKRKIYQTKADQRSLMEVIQRNFR